MIMVYRTTERTDSPWNQFPSAASTKEVLERNRSLWIQQGRDIVDKQPVITNLLSEAKARLEAYGTFGFDITRKYQFGNGKDESPSETARCRYVQKGIAEELEARFRDKGYVTRVDCDTYITVELP